MFQYRVLAHTPLPLWGPSPFAIGTGFTWFKQLLLMGGVVGALPQLGAQLGAGASKEKNKERRRGNWGNKAKAGKQCLKSNSFYKSRKWFRLHVPQTSPLRWSVAASLGSNSCRRCCRWRVGGTPPQQGTYLSTAWHRPCTGAGKEKNKEPCKGNRNK